MTAKICTIAGIYGKKKNLEWYKRSSSDEDEIRKQIINTIARGSEKKRLPYWKHMLIDQKRKNKANLYS